jgi:hypothetical protein
MEDYRVYSIDNAVITKLKLINKEIESTWRTDWNGLFDQIKPNDNSTIRKSIELLSSRTIALIRIKAASMMAEVSQIVSETNIMSQGNLKEALQSCVLSYFDKQDYIERLDPFIGAIHRKFNGLGLVFNPRIWRTDLIEVAFQAGVVNTLRDVHAGIKADFDLLAARSQADPHIRDDSILSSINQCLELKPNFYGMGFNLNAFIEKISKRKRKNP